jgi:hypothetical protein
VGDRVAAAAGALQDTQRKPLQGVLASKPSSSATMCSKTYSQHSAPVNSLQDSYKATTACNAIPSTLPAHSKQVLMSATHFNSSPETILS